MPLNRYDLIYKIQIGIVSTIEIYDYDKLIVK